MSIEIKEGRYYRDRMGRVYGPIISSGKGDWLWTTDIRMCCWTTTGSCYGDGSESSVDLIEEARIVPVNDEGGDA